MNFFFTSYKILILLTVAYAGNLLAGRLPPQTTCVQDGMLRWQEDQSLKSEKKAYCYNAERLEILSYSCTQKEDCQALKYKSVDPATLLGETGSPGFKLCRDIYYGSPKVIEFKADKRWISVSICQFSDGEFIDLPTLQSRSR